MIRFALALLCVSVVPASADYVATKGRLSDEHFYNLVACGAYPDQPCQRSFVRWSSEKANDLTVGITRVDESYPNSNRRMTSSALTRAVKQINKVGANVTLRQVTADPDISVLLLDQKGGSALQDTGYDEIDGVVLEAAYFHVWWDSAKHITRSVIIMSPEVSVAETNSVMLEELVQSLGLLTDIKNISYRNSSVFYEDGNNVAALYAQDADALRRHYPQD